jgi:hypothetical protein
LIIYYSNLGSVGFKSEDTMNGEPLSVPILVSFYGLKKNYQKPSWVSKIMLDSGAFSAWRQKTSVDFKSYIEYCKQHQNDYDVVIELDVVNDPETSIKNYMIMRKKGLKVIPVWHIAEPFAQLERFADIAPYICIGGIAWVDKNTKYAVLKKVFKAFPDPAKVGFHGLGINSTSIIKAFPWISVDAATVPRQARYGRVATPWGWLQVFESPRQTTYFDWQRTKEKKNKVLSYFESISIDLKIMQQENSVGMVERCKASLIVYEKIAKNHDSQIYKPKFEPLF